MDHSVCCLLASVLACICILKSFSAVNAHILVYRNVTNQVILIEEYNDMPAQFGPSLSSAGIKVYGVSAMPIDLACEPINQPPINDYPPASKFAAIIRRGGDHCTFEMKVRNAQQAKFHAVIVYNNETDDLEHMSVKNASGITIPSVFVGYNTGMSLKNFGTAEIFLVINDELPFNINTQLILPFSILIGLCFLIMIFYMIYRCIREERRLRRHRLPKRFLKKLPIVKITKNTDLGYDTCVICIDQFIEGDKVRILPCKHPYHSACIDVWLTKNKRECPICKRKVFTKRVGRSQRNRQSSLDSSQDIDDETRPLLQGGHVSTPTTSRHASFSRVEGGSGNNNIESAASGGDITTDDENMLTSPGQRVNPFDVSPNLPPHLAHQLNNGSTERSIWSWPVLRWFRRPTVISIAAPPMQEDILNDAIAGISQFGSVVSAANNATQTQSTWTTQPSSNNVLNPSLSGSFISAREEEEDVAPLYSIYEPEPAATNSLINTPQQQIMPGVSDSRNGGDTDSVFIQTPTQGGIAVAALPHTTDDHANSPPLNGNNARFW